MENLEKHLTIIGSCVSRDPFDIIKTIEGYDEKFETSYVVDRYIQSVSVFSAMSKPLPKEITEKMVSESESSTCANFFKKMFRLDATKAEKDYFYAERAVQVQKIVEEIYKNSL